MYDEHDNNKFNPNENSQYNNPGAGRPYEDSAPNFVMRDSEDSGSREMPQLENPGRPQEENYQQSAANYQQMNSSTEHNSYQRADSSQDAYRYHTQDQHNRFDRSYIPQEPGGQPHKKHTMAGKIAGVTAAAVLFGTVAGGTMVGINITADYISGNKTAKVSQAETIEDETTMSAGNGSESEQSGTVFAAPALNTDVSYIVEKAMPSVVAINNTILYESNSWFGPSQTYEVPSSGSGIIVGQNDTELLIVTNNHVVQDSKELTVSFIDNGTATAAIKGTDSETDLAVVAVPLSEIPEDTLSKITVATLGDSDSLKVGQGVIAIGNALGYGQSVTVGYVSAVDREVKTDAQVTRDLLQTDAAINPGNSGGALLNMKGEVIGINAAKYSSTEVEGMGYAIPITKVQDIISELMSKKTRVQIDLANQGYLGIQGQNIDEAAATSYDMPKGIYVYKIVEGGAAAKSDLREKDIITKFDGQTVRTMADLKDMLTYYEGGSTVNLTVQSLENGKYIERNVEITLDHKPSGEAN